MAFRSDDNRRFLIVRHRNYRRLFFDVVARWVRVNFPQVRQQFEVRTLPVRVRDWSRYALHVPWMQDPVQRWSPKAYAQTVALADECDRRGIPVVNRVDRLVNATKLRGGQLMGAVGVPVPRMALVHDPQEFARDLGGLNLPLFIREDWGHGRRFFRVDSPDDVARVPWEYYHRPLAVEVTDASDLHDGLFRKYRYIVAGNLGIAHHLHVSEGWVTRGAERVINEQTRDEELAYITKPDPKHELFQRACEAMGLDFVAFDFGYTPEGKLIVWEANPFPHFVFARKRLPYKNPAMHRTMLAIMHLYFTKAGLPVPDEVLEGLQLSFDEVGRRFQIVRDTNMLDRLKAYPTAFPKWPT